MRYYLGFAAGTGRGIESRTARVLPLSLPPNNQSITEEFAIVSHFTISTLFLK